MAAPDIGAVALDEMDMTMPDAQAVIDAFYDAYNRHDWPAAVALYTAEGRHFEAAMDKTRMGAEALLAGLQGFGAMLPDVHWAETERIVSGDHVVVRYSMTGTFTPRSGDGVRMVSLPGVHVFSLIQGRIAATADYWNKDAFLAQIR